MIVVIVNGYPESGKDEFIIQSRRDFNIWHHSTIDVCKDICESYGWSGEKTDESRAMLADLKQWYVKYLDGVFRDFKTVVAWAKKFYNYDFLYVVSREGSEINRFRYWCDKNGHKCVYLFVKKGEPRDYGNNADNDVMKGAIPDIIINNNGTIPDLREQAKTVLFDLLDGREPSIL